KQQYGRKKQTKRQLHDSGELSHADPYKQERSKSSRNFVLTVPKDVFCHHRITGEVNSNGLGLLMGNLESNRFPKLKAFLRRYLIQLRPQVRPLWPWPIAGRAETYFGVQATGVAFAKRRLRFGP